MLRRPAASCWPWPPWPASAPPASPPRDRPVRPRAGTTAKPYDRRTTLTVIGTTDLHGNVYNWDYYKNAEYDDSAHCDIGVAKAATLIKAIRAEVGAGEHPHPRRRRHHPGHAPRVLLRQDRADHQRHHAPDGPGHERGRLRRRGPRQPRVQLRSRPPPRLPEAVPASVAQRQHRRLEERTAALPALRHQEDPRRARQGRPRRDPRPGHPRRRHLGQGQRRGQGQVPRHRRAGQDLRPPSQAGRRRRRRRLLPLGPGHLVVLR